MAVQPTVCYQAHSSSECTCSTLPLKHVILSSPGKVILHGEHAVVYGKSAIATSVDLRCYLLVLPQSTRSIVLRLPDMQLCHTWSVVEVTELLGSTEDELLESIKKLCNASNEPSMQSLACVILLYLITRVMKDKLRTLSGLEIFISSQLPFGAGLGSSAAYSVCIAAALMAACGEVAIHQDNLEVDCRVHECIPIPLKDRIKSIGLPSDMFVYPQFSEDDLNTINRLGLEAEKLVHGTPSGIDNSISTFGGAIEFKGGEFNQIQKMPSLSVLLVYTKVPRSTKKMVAIVRQRYTSYPNVVTPLFNSIDCLVTQSKSVLEELWKLDDKSSSEHDQLYSSLQELLSVNHHLLNALGVGHSSLDKAFHIAHENGLLCKATGAGGGGCAIVLLLPDTTDNVVERTINEMESAGFDCWRTQVGSRGVALHYCN